MKNSCLLQPWSFIARQSVKPMKRYSFIKLFLALLGSLGLFAPSLQACSWDYPIWQIRSKDADAYYRFVRDGRVGYIDRNGKIVVEPSAKIFLGSNSGGEFHNGLLLTGVADGPYIDATGRILLDTGFSRNWDFSEGFAAAMRDDNTNRWGFIDATGKFAIAPAFETYPKGYVHSFSNGVALIEVGKQFGFIDSSGKFIIRPSFLWAKDFSEDRARVIVEGPCTRPGFEHPCDFGETLGNPSEGQIVSRCKFRFIDKSGAFIGTNEFDNADDFSEGLAAVQNNGKWGFIDTTGRLVIPYKFGAVHSFSNGLALAAEGGLWDKKKWGYIDSTGQIVIPFQFAAAEGFSDGLAPVTKEIPEKSEADRWFYIDKSGKRAFPGTFAAASPFFKGVAHVKLIENSGSSENYLAGHYAYIDAYGKTIFRYSRDN